MSRIARHPGFLNRWRTQKPAWPFAINRDSEQSVGLVGWYPMSPAGGGKLFDLLGNGNDGTLTGMEPETDWDSDQIRGGTVLRFDGNAEYISTGKTLSQLLGGSVGEGSVSWWMNPVEAFNDSTIHRFWGQIANGATLPEFSAQKFSDNNFYVGFNATADDDRVTLAASATNYPQNTWSHYTFTWIDGGTSRLYHDGVEIGNNGGGTTTANPTGTDFRFAAQGELPTGDEFNGLFDDFRIYNRALSAAEAWKQWDPSSRWELYYPLRQRTWSFPGVVGGAGMLKQYGAMSGGIGSHRFSKAMTGGFAG